MIKPDRPSTEDARLAALRSYAILDTAPEDAFDDLVRIASAICGVPMASVSLIDQDRQWFKARLGIEGDESDRDSAFCAHAILSPEVMVVPDALQDVRFHDNPLVQGNPNIRFYAGAPLVDADGHALGTLCVLDNRPNVLGDHQLEALRALSRQVSKLLELRRVSRALNVQLEDRAWYESQLHAYQEHLESLNADLAEQTRTDPLTGLPNRRAFAAALEDALGRGKACSVAMLDIDHFKTVNDTHGHAVGDQVLVQVANLLRAVAGGHGMIARHGGEEFAWLLPDATPGQAELSCGHLCQTVRLASMALPVTISIGLAHGRPGEDGAALLARADSALYSAKRNGRDRVDVAA
ncbi:MAG: sensor domain-containing diguanylate cyclase [Xanthomonadaceae bacterium]|nr:sensor domain-containing diguanylate cyclase [Xanthomonadaceae bacterium]